MNLRSHSYGIKQSALENTTNVDVLAKEFITLFRGLIVISLILTMVGGFQLPLKAVGVSLALSASMRWVSFVRRPARSRRG